MRRFPTYVFLNCLEDAIDIPGYPLGTAGDIFIEEMDKILGDLQRVSVIVDDILVYGTNID